MGGATEPGRKNPETTAEVKCENNSIIFGININIQFIDLFNYTLNFILFLSLFHFNYFFKFDYI